MPARTTLLILVFLAGCLQPIQPPSPPATRGTLLCALDQLSQLGYVITPGEPGSGWQQATREHPQSGEQVWIRLVDDRGGSPWLDVRVSGWNQRIQSEGEIRPSFFRMTFWQGQEDVRTVREVCERA
jgi:hypothetical protein